MATNYKSPKMPARDKETLDSVFTTWNATSGVLESNIDYLSGSIDLENIWDVEDTTIIPHTSTHTLTLPYLSGFNNTLVRSNSAGLLEDTTVSITQGASGGSILNFIEFDTDPSLGERVIGDLWVTDSVSTSGKLLKFWDGNFIYSVEMSRE